MIPDFQLAAHATGFWCSPTVTRSVPSLLNEPSTPPSNSFHDNAAPARWLAASALPHSLPISTTAGFVSGEVLGWHTSTLQQGQLGKNAACSSSSPGLEITQQFAGAGSKWLSTWSASSAHLSHVSPRSVWAKVGVGPCPAENLD